MTFLFRAWPWLLLSVAVTYGVTYVNSSSLQDAFSVHNSSMFDAQRAPLVELIHQKDQRSCTDDFYISQICIQTLTIPLELRSLLHVTGRNPRRRKISLSILERLIRGSLFPILYQPIEHSRQFSECDSPLRLTNLTLDFLNDDWAPEIDFVICSSFSLSLNQSNRDKQGQAITPGK
jgi:hypothetical protein